MIKTSTSVPLSWPLNSLLSLLFGFSMLFSLASPSLLKAQENSISFLRNKVSNLNIRRPTSLQFGPDGRLYVAQVNGLIKAFTIERSEAGQYQVTATENINLVQNIPNHNDDGSLNLEVANRQVLGLLVKGSPSQPILYVSSNDPRTGGGNGDLNLDTNSGIISKLSKNAQGEWEKVDLIRGLPKSEHNHATNGLQLDETNNVLYIAQGGHANKGAPSHELAWLPEYAYSAAILEVDLSAIEALPTQGSGNEAYKYDLPTLSGNGPFGGNNGLNQAILVAGGPVQVYAPGFRNAYDIVLSEQGKLYTWDNSSNANWGVPPIMRTSDNLATNITERDFNENVNNVQATHYKINDNLTYFDPFHYISHRGYYGGNPNPTRANPAINTFNGLSPIPEGFDFGFPHGTNTADGLENNFLHSGRENIPKQNSSLFGVMGSTNGLAEYTASNFSGVMQGNILGTSFNGILYRVVLNSEGTDLEHTLPHNGSGINGVIHLAEGFGNWNILDVCAQGDADIFPGTIWIAEYSERGITVLEPNDFNECSNRDPSAFPDEDFDGDGFSNQDEFDNGTDPCSPASTPNDWDKDSISDLNDEDDDNDGIVDIEDAFALDPQNGLDTFLPIEYEWEASNSELAGYILNSGFSGLMINNQTNYQAQFNIDNMTVIGTGGLFTVSNTSPGNALGTQNDQEYGFQFGLNVGQYPGNFSIHTSVAKAFENLPLEQMENQSMGLFLGTGDQSNYLKVVCDANQGNGGIRIIHEVDDIIEYNVLFPINIIAAQNVHLYFLVDKVNQEVQVAYKLENTPLSNLGDPIGLASEWLEGVLATGVISSNQGASPIGATWEFFRVLPINSSSQAEISVISADEINSDIRSARSFKILNNSQDGQKITQIELDLSTTVFSDLVFDPNNHILDLSEAKAFSLDAGELESGFLSADYSQAYLGDEDNGYTKLSLRFEDFEPGETVEFSLDIDPISIKNTSPGNFSGEISALELIGLSSSVRFDDGSGHIGQLYREESQTGIINEFKQNTIKPVDIRLNGLQSPAEVDQPLQSIRIEGEQGTLVKLLVLEGALFTEGLPEGGFNIQEYLANRLLKVVEEKTATLSNNGEAELEVELSRTEVTNGESGINYIVAVAVGSDGQTSLLSNILRLKLKAGPPVASFRINAGGSDYSTLEGVEFSEDAFFSTSNAYNPTTGIEIEGTEDDFIYNSERYGADFGYNFSLDNGNYQVILHFAEIYFGINGRGGTARGVGSRVFDVNIEGDLRLDDFDIFDEAEGSAQALQKSFLVSVMDGELNINFNAEVDNAKVSAIEIIPMGSNTPPTLDIPLADYQFPYDPDLENPFTIEIPENSFSDLQDEVLSYSATQSDGSALPTWLSFDAENARFTGLASQYQIDPNYVDIKVIASDSESLSAFDIFRITLIDPISFASIRINTGTTEGEPFTSTRGLLFQNDEYMSGGSLYSSPNVEIQNTENDALYQSERYGDMTYQIPVVNGAYQVVLHFSENYFGLAGNGGVGSRVFDVNIEGNLHLDNFDIFAKAGGSARAIQEVFYLEVNDDYLDLEFISITNNALINAIEVIPFSPSIRVQAPNEKVLLGAESREMLRLEVPNFGTNTANSFYFNTQGTSQSSDIQKAKLFYTGANPNFINPSLIAEQATPDGNFSFQELNQALGEGSNYFWLYYDLDPSANAGNVIGAKLESLELSNAELNPSQAQSLRTLAQTDSKPGQLIDFDGNNDFITLSHEEKFDFSQAMTVEAWIKVDIFDRQWQALITKGDNSWRLHRNNNTNKINFAFTSETNSLVQVNSISDLNDSQWHHVAGVYTGSQLQIYIDGVKEGEVNSSALIRNNDQAVMIGSNSQRNNRFFKGQMDEVRIWNIARSQAQIRENMHLSSKGTEEGLVSYWQFNEGPDLYSYDLVGEVKGLMSAGLEQSNWVEATLPIGGGQSSRALASALDELSFGRTDLEIRFGNQAPEGELVVTKLQNMRPALLDPADLESKNNDYWIINNYGNTESLSEMTLRFYLPADFLLNPNFLAYKMYKRSSNAHDEAWESFAASAINLDENYLEFSGITSFSQILLTSDNSSLPVSLVSFEANRLNNAQVQLEWKTISEVNNQGFEIEKSQDALNFQKIGFQEGAGNSLEEKNYSFIDPDAPQLTYYRLKQIDADGQFTYSSVLSVAGGEPQEIQVYPNPISALQSSLLRLKGGTPLQNQGIISLVVRNQEAQDLFQYQGSLAELERALQKKLPHLANGLYFLIFQSEKSSRTILKMIKQ